jgi:hypothetical protein
MYTLRPSTSLQMPKIELHRPGIGPGPPAWQAGTLPKELSRQLILRVVGASHLAARERKNIKFASAGDRTRVACVTGGHST